MKICVFRNDQPREGLLAEAFVAGLKQHGDNGVIRRVDGSSEPATDCEVAAMVGVKSRDLFRANMKAGLHTVYMDKGYSRHRKPGGRTWEYWRVAVNAHQPTAYFMNDEKPSNRADEFGWQFNGWRKRGNHIVFCGSSAKYARFYDLPDPTEYAQKIIKRIMKMTERPVIYRPKPSWRDAVPIEGTRYSGPDQSMNDVLANAHCVITHGSNACFEATLAGVPSIVLGEAVAKPISSTSIDDIDDPVMAGRKAVYKWTRNLAYCQWTLDEFSSGEAWETIRPQIFR